MRSVCHLHVPTAVCLSIAMAVTAGCCPQGLYEVLVPDPAVRLPLDESPHCTGGEWWYYTGRLTSDGGHIYGVEAVIFHVPNLTPLGITDAWAAHYAILDTATGEFFYNQGRWYSVPGPASSSVQGFDLDTPLIHMQGCDGQDHLQAAMTDGTMTLDLQLADQRGPVLHNTSGYINYGSAGNSFYYSRPQMQATGTLVSTAMPRTSPAQCGSTVSGAGT